MEPESGDHGLHIPGPEFALGIVLARRGFFRHAMAAVIEAHQPELVGQGTLKLLGPGEVTLTEAMDQQNGFAMGLAVFMHRELEATATSYGVYGHVFSSTLVGQCESLRGSKIPAAGLPPKEITLPSGSSI